MSDSNITWGVSLPDPHGNLRRLCSDCQCRVVSFGETPVATADAEIHVPGLVDQVLGCLDGPVVVESDGKVRRETWRDRPPML
jgi:hypothetical protein